MDNVLSPFFPSMFISPILLIVIRELLYALVISNLAGGTGSSNSSPAQLRYILQSVFVLPLLLKILSISESIMLAIKSPLPLN